MRSLFEKKYLLFLSKCKNCLLYPELQQEQSVKARVHSCAVTHHIKATVSRKRGSNSHLTWGKRLAVEIQFML